MYFAMIAPRFGKRIITTAKANKAMTQNWVWLLLIALAHRDGDDAF
jgi:hypothetical protein